MAFVHYLPSLGQLTLINNDLNKLPPLLGYHKKLNMLSVEGNPLKSIRRAVIEKGTVSVLQFLKDKFVQGQDDIVEKWALTREKEASEYEKVDYSYKKENYDPSKVFV